MTNQISTYDSDAQTAFHYFVSANELSAFNLWNSGIYTRNLDMLHSSQLNEDNFQILYFQNWIQF